MPDPFDLDRFVSAQAPVLDRVRCELRAGAKRSHWMWFVFPQLRGLGHSAMARHYGLSGLEEARAYLSHPLLGDRLREATTLVVAGPERSLSRLFGSPDDMKFRSSMTLFAAAAPGETVFGQALRGPCSGRPDPETLRRMGLPAPDAG